MIALELLLPFRKGSSFKELGPVSSSLQNFDSRMKKCEWTLYRIGVNCQQNIFQQLEVEQSRPSDLPRNTGLLLWYNTPYEELDWDFDHHFHSSLFRWVSEAWVMVGWWTEVVGDGVDRDWMNQVVIYWFPTSWTRAMAVAVQGIGWFICLMFVNFGVVVESGYDDDDEVFGTRQYLYRNGLGGLLSPPFNLLEVAKWAALRWIHFTMANDRWRSGALGWLSDFYGNVNQRWW